MSSQGDVSCARKDSYYRLKKMDEIDWEKLLLNFVRRFLKLCKKGGQGEKSGYRCLWDHVSMRYVLGFRLLVVGYFDGKSFLPVSFSLHQEKGKNQSTPMD